MSEEDLRSSAVSRESISSTATATTKPKFPLKNATPRDLVKTLTSFVRIETDEKNGTTREFVVVKCPNGQYCKNGNAEIRYPKNFGYKNPLSHLRSCLAKVCAKSQVITIHFLSNKHFDYHLG